jgi:hypothetical protein
MFHLPFSVYGFGFSFEIGGTSGDWPVFQQATGKVRFETFEYTNKLLRS